MKQMSTKMMVEAGVLIGLAQLLSYVKIWEAPYGGSVTAGSMIPIIFYAVRWGVKPGVFAGMVYGILQFILGPKYSFHIISILFDYVIAFAMIGLAGLTRKSFGGIFTGTFIGIFGRFACHVISGAVIWASYAPKGMNPWIYSMAYNGAYLVPEFAVSIIIVGIIYRSSKNLVVAA